MAKRSVFVVSESAPFFRMSEVDFVWNGGLAKSQKQKNIKAIHEAFTRHEPGKKVLEISSKSMQEGGTLLSAFSLKKYIPSLEKSIPVECAYQAGKVFEKGGPYSDILLKTSKEAKQDERLKTSGRLTHFVFEGQSFPTVPTSLFYDYLYINALQENPKLAEIVLEYDAFTDIEFDPNKGISCQAKAAATFVSLSRLGLIEKVKDIESFLSVYHLPAKRSAAASKQGEKKVEEVKAPAVLKGMVIHHKTFGVGTVVEVLDTLLKVNFPSAGEKVLGLDWCRQNCEIQNE